MGVCFFRKWRVFLKMEVCCFKMESFFENGSFFLKCLFFQNCITTSRRFKCVIEKWVTPLDFVS